MEKFQIDEHDALEIFRQEYAQLWKYYERTLDERKNLFDWYFRVVGLPGSVLTGYTLYQAVKCTYGRANYLLSGLFAILFALGWVFYATYAKESRNSKGYFERIQEMRDFLASIPPDKMDISWAFGPIFQGREDHPSRHSSAIHTWRGFGLAIVNSAVGTGSLLSLTYCATLPFLTAAVGMLAPIALFTLHYIWYRHEFSEFPLQHSQGGKPKRP